MRFGSTIGIGFMDGNGLRWVLGGVVTEGIVGVEFGVGC